MHSARRLDGRLYGLLEVYLRSACASNRLTPEEIFTKKAIAEHAPILGYMKMKVRDDGACLAEMLSGLDLHAMLRVTPFELANQSIVLALEYKLASGIVSVSPGFMLLSGVKSEMPWPRHIATNTKYSEVGTRLGNGVAEQHSTPSTQNLQR